MPAQQCTRHPDRETYRICGRCERPFCPDCLITTPVGGRCKECARGPAIPRLRIQPWRWPLIALVALVGGLVAGTIAGYASYFGLFLAYLAGQGIAGGTLAVSGRKPGQALLMVTVVFIVIGVLLTDPVQWALDAIRTPEEYGAPGAEFLAGAKDGLLNVWNWACAALMALGASMRLR